MMKLSAVALMLLALPMLGAEARRPHHRREAQAEQTQEVASGMEEQQQSSEPLFPHRKHHGRKHHGRKHHNKNKSEREGRRHHGRKHHNKANGEEREEEKLARLMESLERLEQRVSELSAEEPVEPIVEQVPTEEQGQDSIAAADAAEEVEEEDAEAEADEAARDRRFQQFPAFPAQPFPGQQFDAVHDHAKYEARLDRKFNIVPAGQRWNFVPSFPRTFGVGCYNDAINNGPRVLPNMLGTGSTPASCQALAASQGYKFAGVEYGGECWAGNDQNLLVSLGTSTVCNMPCNADNTQLCGGPFAVFVSQLRF